MKRMALLVGALTVAASFGVATPSSAVAFPSNFCGDQPPPCISSATRDGVAITPSDRKYYPTVVLSTSSGSHNLLWQMQNKTGPDPYDLGAAARRVQFVITIDTGATNPRVAFTFGHGVTVDRTNDGDGTYHVTITANPIQLQDNSNCTVNVWPWVCPTPTKQWKGYLGGEVTDYNEWTDVGQRDSFQGMNLSTNIEVTSIPPEITTDASGNPVLLIRMASAHFMADGSTVFHGFEHIRIPNAFLRAVYGIDYPSTLTSAGLVPTGAGSGAVVSVHQETGGDAMLVDITNMTFSAHLVKVKRGTITPTRPQSLHAVRTTIHRGKLKFGPAKPRGSHITGYRGRCVSGSSVVTAKAASSPIVVTGLLRGRAYACQVRALSKAGPGLWSGKVIMPRHP
jgi:hypothetical protein